MVFRAVAKNFQNNSFASQRFKKRTSQFAANRAQRGAYKPFKRSAYKKKAFKKMPYKSRIAFPAQEKFLRSRVVSRKFKMLQDMNIKLQPSTGYTAGLTTLENLVGSKKFIGHIAEYEDFAISYVKIKAKTLNAKTESCIVDKSVTQQQYGTMKAANETKDGVAIKVFSSQIFQKVDVGNAVVTRKQSLLAAHKKARTNPWIKTKDFVNSRASNISETMFPSYPEFVFSTLGGTGATPSYVVIEYSVYVVTKNRLVETTNLRTELVEMNMKDVVDEQAITMNATPQLIARPEDPTDKMELE